MHARYSDAVVLERHGLTDRIAELRIGSGDGRALPMAEAGSHIELRFGGADGRFLRHYSVVGPLSLDDRTEPFWRIAVQREDRARGSAHIHANFRSGTRLRVSRPIGAFRLARNVPHALLIAGGIGITPMADRGPLTWIWMGSPDLADEALIPDTSWLTDPGWGTVAGQFHIDADYVSMHENLIDQTHFPFLHPDTVGTPEYARSRLTASTADDQVIIRRALRDCPPPAVYGKPAGIMGKKVDRTSQARFVSPAMHVAFAEIIDPAPDPGQPQRYRYTITHCFTPETNTAIHYWWFNSRDYKPGDAATDAFLTEASAKAYQEDVEALEWIMDVVRNDADPHIELSFAPDKPGLMARRIIYRLAKKENQ